MITTMPVFIAFDVKPTVVTNNMITKEEILENMKSHVAMNVVHEEVIQDIACIHYEPKRVEGKGYIRCILAGLAFGLILLGAVKWGDARYQHRLDMKAQWNAELTSAEFDRGTPCEGPLQFAR